MSGYQSSPERDINSPERFVDRPIKSYVKRQGRMTDSQLDALESLGHRFLLNPQEVLQPKAVFSSAKPLVLEIGFGNGECLVSMAEQMPEYNFIGLDVHAPGVGHCLRLIAQKQLTNVRLYHADALEVLSRCIPPSSVMRVNLFFPDPWPKKKHHKRRIIRPAFFDVLKNIVRPGALLHFATDWQPYVVWTRQVLTQLKDFGEVVEDPNSFLRPKTKFELRGERMGHQVSDLYIQFNTP